MREDMETFDDEIPDPEIDPEEGREGEPLTDEERAEFRQKSQEFARQYAELMGWEAA